METFRPQPPPVGERESRSCRRGCDKTCSSGDSLGDIEARKRLVDARHRCGLRLDGGDEAGKLPLEADRGLVARRRMMLVCSVGKVDGQLERRWVEHRSSQWACDDELARRQVWVQPHDLEPDERAVVVLENSDV